MIATRVGALVAARKRGYKLVNNKTPEMELNELA